MGKLKSTKYVRQVRHPEDRARSPRHRQGSRRQHARADGRLARRLWPFASAARGRCGGRYGDRIRSLGQKRDEGVWLIGMRYKIINAETTGAGRDRLQPRKKMEVGAKSSQVLGVVTSRSRAAWVWTRWCSG